MEISSEQVFAQLQKRAQSDPLVAEIIRSCALEAVLEQATQPEPNHTELGELEVVDDA